MKKLKVFLLQWDGLSATFHEPIHVDGQRVDHASLRLNLGTVSIEGFTTESFSLEFDPDRKPTRTIKGVVDTHSTDVKEEHFGLARAIVDAFSEAFEKSWLVGLTGGKLSGSERKAIAILVQEARKVLGD